MAPITRLLAVSALLAFALVATAGVPTGPAVPPAGKQDPGLPVLEESWDRILSDLRLEFFDPDTSRTFTAAGPFEILEQSSHRVVARGAPTDGNGSPELTLVANDGQLWVVARFAAREFATRLQ